MEEIFTLANGAETFPHKVHANHRITVGQKPIRRRKRSNIDQCKKRKLSVEQWYLLELNFEKEHRLETQRKDKLASEMGLDTRQVAVWFQNRRARWKNKKLEEEYAKLKTSFKYASINNRGLKSDVLQLKERLMQAENEMKRLSEKMEPVTNSSLSSSHIWSHGLSPSNFFEMNDSYNISVPTNMKWGYSL